MKKISTYAEILLGIAFVFGGVNGMMIPFGLEPFIPATSQSKFAIVLSQTNYIFLIQKAVELLAGTCLLVKKFRFAAILALTPITISILSYHLFEDTHNILIALIMFFSYLLALSGHTDKVKTVFKD